MADDEKRNVLESLPIDRMVGAPLEAMIEAQFNASRRYLQFLEELCLEKDGKAKMLPLEFEETLVDTEGNLRETRQRSMAIPLMAAVPHPTLCIDEGRVDFELEITESTEEKSEESSESGEPAAGAGPAPPPKTMMKGRVSKRASQTRSTDSRARYSFSTVIKRDTPPEALMRVIDYLTDAATVPVQKKQVPNKPGGK